MSRMRTFAVDGDDDGGRYRIKLYKAATHMTGHGAAAEPPADDARSARSRLLEVAQRNAAARHSR